MHKQGYTNHQDGKVLFMFSHKQTFCTQDLILLQPMLFFKKKQYFRPSDSLSPVDICPAQTLTGGAADIPRTSRGRKHNNEL